MTWVVEFLYIKQKSVGVSWYITFITSGPFRPEGVAVAFPVCLSVHSALATALNLYYLTDSYLDKMSNGLCSYWVVDLSRSMNPIHYDVCLLIFYDLWHNFVDTHLLVFGPRLYYLLRGSCWYLMDALTLMGRRVHWSWDIYIKFVESCCILKYPQVSISPKVTNVFRGLGMPWVPVLAHYNFVEEYFIDQNIDFLVNLSLNLLIIDNGVQIN